MRKFLIKSILFILGIFALAVVFQVLLFLRIQNKSIAHHDTLDITSHINADLVLMGNSRCWSHLDPAFFKEEFKLKSVNLGTVGHPELSIAYARLKDYLAYNRPPKFALLNVDPFTNGGDLSKPNENMINKDAFARYAFAPLNKDWETVKHFGFNNWEKYVPLYAIFKYKNFSKIVNPNFNSLYVTYGYSKKDIQWDTIKIPINGENKKNFRIHKDFKNVKNMLDKLNKLCRDNNIQLICIQSPVHKSIHEEHIFEVAGKITNDLNIPFVNANYESIRVDINYFQDSNHLNLDGVTAMNQKLKEESVLIETLKKPQTFKGM